MRSLLAASAVCVLAVAGDARAECPGNPDAIGTARTIVIDPSEHARIGGMQYAETLPLEDKEVVLTFDDGPIPPYSNRVLETLAAECAKATFFLVGRQARAFPHMVRRIYNEGHTIATHSQNHPFRFERLPPSRAAAEIEDGIASTAAALGDDKAVAPFFRVPGLRTSASTESYLASRAVMVWSADFPADDWRHISAKQVLQRALDRIEKKGKGVLLLHDIQPATALALPDLLKALKAGGYRIVHVVPAGPDRPKTVTEPQQWVLPGRRAWPRVVEIAERPQLPVPSPESFGWPDLFQAKSFVTTRPVRLKLTRRPGHQTISMVEVQWPQPLAAHVAAIPEAALPAPSPQSFGIPHPFGPHIRLPASDEGTPDATAPSRAAGIASPAVALP